MTYQGTNEVVFSCRKNAQLVCFISVKAEIADITRYSIFYKFSGRTVINNDKNIKSMNSAPVVLRRTGEKVANT